MNRIQKTEQLTARLFLLLSARNPTEYSRSMTTEFGSAMLGYLK